MSIGRKRRSFTRDFKLSVLKRMAETDNIRGLAAELGIERRLLYCWRDAFAVSGEAGLRRAGRPSAADRAEAALAVHQGGQVPDPAQRVAELERKVVEQQVALDFLRAALRHVRAQRRKTGVPRGKASTP
ncbi:MAG TPA: transposase [Acetobacteraceae bacterium]|nr:transposase [Acetobacteraceae bacterium]